MDKIELIKQAIENAKNHQSKMDEVAWDVPALSSIKIRHLMNNLGAISTRYLECGTHKGGVFCSVIRNNPNIEMAFAIDNYASDADNEDKAYPQFKNNVAKCKSENTWSYNTVNNTFDVPPNLILKGYDLYLYDADHSYESERQAITHFLPAMADVFILCKDDWQYGDVKRGTLDGIKDSGCEVLFEHELLNPEPYNEEQHLNDLYWRGFYIALLKKKL